MIPGIVSTKSDESFFADILAAIDYGQREPEVLREQQDENLTDILNRIIQTGAHFDVTIDEFKTANSLDLRQSDRDFLDLNKSDVLCTLQQSLLSKHLFSHRKDMLSDFAFEIAEREAIMSGDGSESFFIHCEAVKDITKKWFLSLLEGETAFDAREK
jgi:hypothetical protein